MVTLISNSPDETLQIGRAWGESARPGWVIGLTGDLGAGKTQLVKGIALGLGIQARITSPTFALVNEYAGGRLPLAHLDLYRLDTPDQIVAAGLEDYLYPRKGVSVVEWVERWTVEENARMPRFRRVHIRTVDEQVREINYEDAVV